jgi:tetratricopeptide (TPR) repeat protein
MPIRTLIGWIKMLTKITVLLMFLVASNVPAKQVQVQDADYYFMIGEKFLLDEDAEQAKECFQKAAILGDDSSYIHMKISEAYMLSGDLDLANTEIKKAVELDPSNIAAKLMYVESLIVTKEYQEALAQCNDVLKLEPDNRDAVSYKSAMLIKLDRNSESEKVLEQYRTLKPNDEFPYFYSGIIHQIAGELDLAEKYYKISLDINPSFEPAVSGLISIYKKSKNGAEAIKKLEELSKQFPELKEHVIKLSVIEGEKQKDKNKALIHYNRAIKYIDEQLKENPSEYTKLIQKAMILEEAGKIKETATTLEEALTQYPNNERIMYYLGVTYDKLGQKQKAVNMMKKVVEINTENAEALNYIGFFYADEQPENLIEAESLVKKALHIMPDSYYILDSMGWVLYKKGDLKEARKFLESALKMSIKENSFESEIFEHLIALYNASKDDKSRDALRNTLLEMLNSDNYSDKKVEIQKIIERINDSTIKVH